MQGPSFICPGAQKSGTTWLQAQLRRHPQFWMPPQKEVDYLAEYPTSREKYAARLPNVLKRFPDNKNGAARADWWRLFTSDWSLDKYTRLFEPAGDRLSGDVSPNYSRLTTEEVARAARLVPDARVVILLRDPVSRSWSYARHMVTRGPKKDLPPQRRAAAMEKFALSERCYEHSNYVRILSDWQAAFGRDRVHVAYYDDLQARPVAMLNGILAFLGADPVPQEQQEMLNKAVNVGEHVDCPEDLLRRLTEVFAPMLANLDALLPAGERPGWAA
ncbi:sulfotransferase [Sedimentitalea sp. JM2-8]|uniref:Sulfotransferase n=1 Tax=Sedimentitalea xiamensis TaxID=3050037 RepID=A0ABT7FHC7_9RHOB|nr:sulfotransferase [Sedimentitalea xiamensis]MDK3074536.1 sulfotransferase [Sedimentitalea xiamensis]